MHTRFLENIVSDETEIVKDGDNLITRRIIITETVKTPDDLQKELNAIDAQIVTLEAKKEDIVSNTQLLTSIIIK